MSDTSSRCVLYTDGGARGNPGVAGAGWVLSSPDGSVLASGGRYLGTATNNVAEYQGVICGLKAARAAGCARVEVRSDSELLVRQMTGRYRVKNDGLKPLYAEACGLVGGFAEVRFVHVRREENVEADRLANEAMDALADVGDALDEAAGPPQGTLF